MIIGTCSVCEVPLVSHYRWFTLNQRPEGTAPRGGQGLCRNHYQQARRDAQPKPHSLNVRGSEGRSAEEVLEDYHMIRDDVSTVAEAADRMGMSWSALDKALYRARQRGDDRALPPQDQLERGIKYGPARHLVA